VLSFYCSLLFKNTKLAMILEIVSPLCIIVTNYIQVSIGSIDLA